MIETLSASHPEAVSCQAMATPFNSYYHFVGNGKTVREKKAIEDTHIRNQVEKLINGDCSEYGYRMMTRSSKKMGSRLMVKVSITSAS